MLRVKLSATNLYNHRRIGRLVFHWNATHRCPTTWFPFRFRFRFCFRFRFRFRFPFLLLAVFSFCFNVAVSQAVYFQRIRCGRWSRYQQSSRILPKSVTPQTADVAYLITMATAGRCVTLHVCTWMRRHGIERQLRVASGIDVITKYRFLIFFFPFFLKEKTEFSIFPSFSL